MQLNHYNSNFKKQTFPVTLVCDNVTNAPNVGSLFRVSDAFGIEEIVFCGEDIPLGKRMKRTSRSTEKYVTHRTSDCTLDVIEELKAKEYQIIALEITDSSKPLHSISINTQNPLALIIGNENFGISETILEKADVIAHINMFGENSSMNVVQATSIALYEMTNQLRK